jgi:hypothetical protein
MLIRKEYRGCSRLCWEPEDFAAEAPEASFEFRGRTHLLEFDGCVDELIWRNLRNADCTTFDIAELYEAVPLVELYAPQLSGGGKVNITLTSGSKWEVTQRASERGIRVVLRAHPGQTATLFKDGDGVIRSLVLRTEGQGITHEITARPDHEGDLEAISEAVTVYHQAC